MKSAPSAHTLKAFHSPARGFPTESGYPGERPHIVAPTLQGLNGGGGTGRITWQWLVAWCALAFLTSIVPARSLGAPPADAERQKVPDKEGAPPQKFATEKKGEAEKNAAEEKKLDPRAMIRKLQAPTTVNFDKTPLKDVAAQLSKRHGVVIRLDEAALKRAKVAPDAPITATIKNLTLNAALGQLLKDLKLRHLAKDGEIVIKSDVEDLDLEKVGKEHVERKAEEARERAELADKAAAAARDAAVAQRAAAMMGQAMAPADLAAMEKQFNRQFNAAARIELHFVDKVCEPTPEQRTEIDDALEKYRADLVKKYSENHKRLARGGRQVAGNPFAGDVHEMVRRSIARTVKTNLSAGQVARFEEEIARRTADRKQAAVSHLVARLDGDLNLSAEQRDKLTESLAVNWNVTWDQQFEVMLRQPGAQFLPQLPERLVTPYLTPTQRKIWRAGRENNQPNQGVIFFQGGFAGGLGIAVDVLGNDVDDEDDDEPVPPQAPDAGRKNRSNDAKEEKANDGKAR